MLPAFLITFREVIEASLIVATILGILVKLKHHHTIKTVWLATSAASGVSIALIIIGSLFGYKVHELYTGKIEEFTEGSLMIVSSAFITWAVFFLHNYFTHYKIQLLTKIKNTLESEEQKGIFILVFTAVFREGFEIVLFLSTVYFSANPQSIFIGFLSGILIGLLISASIFTATIRMPISYAFKTTSVLLVLFAAGLLARGVHEFVEVGFIPEMQEISFAFMPHSGTYAHDVIQAVFGITHNMDMIQIALYLTYIIAMLWYLFLRKKPHLAKKN
jgi:high-affinity iron transporter